MVLPLKRWKSRTSPGIAAGVITGSPFILSFSASSAGGRVCDPGFRAIGRASKLAHPCVGAVGLAEPWAPGRNHAQVMCRRGVEQSAAGSRSEPDNLIAASGLPRAADEFGDAGWSSPVARQAHNLKVAGSNPAPATTERRPALPGFFCVRSECGFVARNGLATVSVRSRLVRGGIDSPRPRIDIYTKLH